ncbi:MAG: ABC transporter ATP-binding protein [Desulfosporosinus sp.]
MLLKFENVRKSYLGADRKNLVILENLNLEIENGDFITVTGPSGSGKTTLLSIAGCLLRPDQGKVEFRGVNTAGLKDREISHLRNRWIGFVFQASHLIPSLTIMENVLVPQIFAKDDNFLPEAAGKKRAMQLLEELGIFEQAKQLPYQLSLGQRRRVSLARALINDPALVLADEPTGDLDPVRGRQVVELLLNYWQQGTTVLTVTHEPWLAELAPKQYRLDDKRLISTFSKAENTK